MLSNSRASRSATRSLASRRFRAHLSLLSTPQFSSSPVDSLLSWWLRFWKGQGALAEYTVVNAANVVRKPALLSHAEAAALPVALLTPYWSLVTIGGLKMGAGQRVFVVRPPNLFSPTRALLRNRHLTVSLPKNGGSGGVGTGAIQIAKAFGAYVVSTSSPTSASLLTSLGADALIDYRAVGSLPSYLAQHYASDSPEGFDIILDCIGLNELYVASPGYLRPEGVFLNVGGAPLRGWRDVGKVIWDVLGAVARPRWAGGVPREYKFIQTPPEMTVSLPPLCSLLAFCVLSLKPFARRQGPTLKAAFEFVSTGSSIPSWDQKWSAKHD